MHLTIELYASLRESAGTGRIELDGLPADLSLGALKALLLQQRPELGALEHVRGVLDNAYVPDSTTLTDGACVALLPPVSGGAAPADDALPDLEVGVFELCGEPLDPATCQARVLADHAGAAVLFTGTTRDRNRGRSVLRLEYEAFEAMTGPEMARIFARCRTQFGDPDGARPERRLRMLCQHRTGAVAVGEASVVIAVASPHRAQAFEACRFLIDELKASLPIWKKEFYPDGEHWAGERS